eukprot:2354609-Alexandrium_andersonii.AAC.1
MRERADTQTCKLTNAHAHVRTRAHAHARAHRHVRAHTHTYTHACDLGRPLATHAVAAAPTATGSTSKTQCGGLATSLRRRPFGAPP